MSADLLLQLSYGLCRNLIWCASILVPSIVRHDWRQEWRSELWYLRDRQRSGAVLWLDSLSLLRFASGACIDAALLCPDRGDWRTRLSAPRGSAQECFTRLFATLAVALGFALLLPNVRGHLRPAHVAHAQELMLIESSYGAEHGDPRLPLAQYESWVHLHQRIFSQFAFYELDALPVSEGSSSHTQLRVARVHGDVLALLGLQPEQLNNPVSGQGAVISRALWHAHSRDRERDGRLSLVLGGQRVPVTGIAPAAAASLPGHPDVWIDAERASVVAETHKGFLLGRVSPRFHDAPWGAGWSMSAPSTNGETKDFTCVSLDQSLRQPWDLFAFAVLLALLALPATTSLPLGEYRFRPSDLPQRIQARRWAFLAGKMAVMLTVVYLGCMDLAFADSHWSRATAEWIELVSCFGGCLWGLRWTLRDQRQRCPVCLGRLSQPAKVGHPSRYFLAWSGTELICAGGHGLLHVPEIATSWFGTQRWLALDASWQVLFPGRRTPSTVYF